MKKRPPTRMLVSLTGDTVTLTHKNFDHMAPSPNRRHFLLTSAAAGQQLLRDKSKLAFTNHAEATKTIVRRDYRDGFAPPKI